MTKTSSSKLHFTLLLLINITLLSACHSGDLSKENRLTTSVNLSDAPLEINILETGKSDCIVIKVEDKTVMIDTGLDQNGEKIAEIIEESRNDEVQKNSFLKAAPAYTYLGAKSKKISWGKATTAAVLASMIATVLGYIGGAAIIGAVGATSLGVIASAASNGVVNAKTYSRKTGKITNYKYIWSFTPSGSRKYGDYTSYVTV